MRNKVVYPGKFRALLMVVGLAALVGALGASTSLAKSPPPVGNCTWPDSVQPFLPWADPGLYFLVPGGSFERGMGDWSLTGGAQPVDGNETFYVRSASDSRSLSLPAGSTATSSTVCVSVQSPELRLFVRNTRNPTSTLAVDINYTDKNGKQKTKNVGQLSGTGDWSPIPPLYFLKPLDNVLKKNGQTTASFTFRPSDSKGNWQIDDLYIDPLKSH